MKVPHGALSPTAEQLGSASREELARLLTDIMGIKCHNRGLTPARNLLEKFGKIHRISNHH